jgi:hypothetical protein
MPLPWYTNPETLRREGFCGFLTVRELRQTKLACVPNGSSDIGVYIVVRPETAIPKFLQKSTGGFFKGRDPTVSIEELETHWVSHSPILYVGKAGSPGKKRTLRTRLREYLDFGLGRPVAHWGGRFIWQLPCSDQLLVCWKRTPNAIPRLVERQMIEDFENAFGKLPFANRRK